MEIKKRPSQSLSLLGYQVSNLEKQDQNLLCYHYTIAQSFLTVQRYKKNRTSKLFPDYFHKTFPYKTSQSIIYLKKHKKKIDFNRFFLSSHKSMYLCKILSYNRCETIQKHYLLLHKLKRFK